MAYRFLFAICLLCVAAMVPAESETSVKGKFPPLKLVTESYPPFNMLARNGKVTGIGTELVQMMLERNGITSQTELLPWSRALHKAQTEANTGVYVITRTPQREKLFKWLDTPLIKLRWVFLAKADSDISISSLEEAKQYRVGGYNSDAAAMYLEEQGFKLDWVRKDTLNVQKLARGRIDLWPTSHIVGPYVARQEGIGPVKELFTFKEVEMGLALNLDTPTSLLIALDKTLREMHQDGTVERIIKKYR